MLPPAVVLSGHLMALGVVRSLGRRGVGSIVLHYRDDVDVAHRSRYAVRGIRTVHPERDEDAFMSVLTALGPKVEGSPLIPASDETLSVIARHKEELSRWYRVLAPDADIVERIISKEHTYALADAIGVAAPRTHHLASIEDLERHRDEFAFPCLIKPSQSHRYVEVFRRKMMRVDNVDELRAAYRQAAEARLEVLLQELIPGDDRQGVNYNSYRTDRGPIVEFTAQKVRLTPRNFGPPSVVISRRIPDVIEPGRRILDALGYEGYSCVEFKRDARDGTYKLMEVNGRFNLSSLLSERCGINFPWLAYRHVVLDELEPVNDYQEGVYWMDGTKDLVYGLAELVRRPRSILEFLAPYTRPRVFAVLDRTDLRPFAARWGLLAAGALDGAQERLRRLLGSDTHRPA
ncbi:MAG: hypothetical protein ACRDG7_10660 [Candidatus Limnocylindria bacterium]